MRDLVEVREYNDAAGVRELLAREGDTIAAVIVEPVFHNAGCGRCRSPGFLETLREACTASGTLLIFDEVITGFRHGPGGAQGRYGVTPDLTTMGKALGNGFPISVLAGRGRGDGPPRPEGRRALRRDVRRPDAQLRRRAGGHPDRPGGRRSTSTCAGWATA